MKLPMESLEEEEHKILALRKAIKDGIHSGVAKDFNPKKHLALLKNRKGRELTNKLK
jgi:antitoxin ParD1/3/4